MSVRIVQDYCVYHWHAKSLARKIIGCAKSLARKIIGCAKSLGTQSTLGQWKVTRVLVAIRQ